MMTQISPPRRPFRHAFNKSGALTVRPKIAHAAHELQLDARYAPRSEVILEAVVANISDQADPALP
jgi:hypothetical protein